MDLSIISPTANPAHYRRLVSQAISQSVIGISYEHIIIQESDGAFDPFYDARLPPNARIIRQKKHYDNGANARDVGLATASGEFVIFWDDDNLYYNHAIVGLYTSAIEADIGIAKTMHNGLAIPTDHNITPGDIDTMCFCVRRTLALTEKWEDGLGRYNDYRWISKLAKKTTKIRYSPIIIGEHL